MINRKRYLQLIFSGIFTVGIFIFLFHRLPLAEIFKIIKSTNFNIVCLTLFISAVSNILISAYRWKLILKESGILISLKESLLIKMGSNIFVDIFPVKTGEFFRMLYLRRLQKIPYSKSILSIGSEYLLNITALLCSIFLGGIIYLGSHADFSLLKSFSGCNPVVFGALNIFGRLKNRLNNKYYRLFRISLKNAGKLMKKKNILFYTFLFWIAELFNVYLLSIAIGISVPLYGIFLFMPIVIILGSTSITFAGLGIRETAIIFLFLKFASAEALFSLGLLYSFVESLFPMFISLGLTGSFLNKILWSDKRAKLEQ